MRLLLRGLPAAPAPAGMRIGLLGGSFNPPHAAHRLISLTALKRLRLDQVWWMVTPGNPLKEHSGLAPLGERIRLSPAGLAAPAHQGYGLRGRDRHRLYGSGRFAFLGAGFRASISSGSWGPTISQASTAGRSGRPFSASCPSRSRTGPNGATGRSPRLPQAASPASASRRTSAAALPESCAARVVLSFRAAVETIVDGPSGEETAKLAKPRKLPVACDAMAQMRNSRAHLLIPAAGNVDRSAASFPRRREPISGVKTVPYMDPRLRGDDYRPVRTSGAWYYAVWPGPLRQVCLHLCSRIKPGHDVGDRIKRSRVQALRPSPRRI